MPILIICTKTFTPLHLLQSTPLTHWLNKYKKLNNTIIPFLEFKRFECVTVRNLFGTFCENPFKSPKCPQLHQTMLNENWNQNVYCSTVRSTTLNRSKVRLVWLCCCCFRFCCYFCWVNAFRFKVLSRIGELPKQLSWTIHEKKWQQKKWCYVQAL